MPTFISFNIIARDQHYLRQMLQREECSATDIQSRRRSIALQSCLLSPSRQFYHKYAQLLIHCSHTTISLSFHGTSSDSVYSAISSTSESL